MDSKAYWKLVEDTKLKLIDKFIKSRDNGEESYNDLHSCYIVSIEDPILNMVGGRVVQVSWYHASKFILDKSHRLATTGEVAAFLEETAKRVINYNRSELRRQKKTTAIVMSSEQAGFHIPTLDSSALSAPHAEKHGNPVKPPVTGKGSEK